MEIIYGNAPNQPKTGITIDLVGTVRLIFKEGDKVYMIADNFNLRTIEELSGFSVQEFIHALDWEDGYYYINHYSKRGGYLGKDWNSVCTKLVRLGMAKNKRKIKLGF